MRTISLAVFNLLILIPVIKVCLLYYKFLESCIYLSSGIIYYIGKVICQDPDAFEEYLSLKLTKFIAEVLGWVFTLIGISALALVIKTIISWI